MQNLLPMIEKINYHINCFAWGPFMLVLLFGTGIYLSFITGFIQVRKFGYIMKNTVGSLFKKKKDKNEKNLSPFEAMSTALAGTVGTGNIAGVTGAIIIGGSGAIFWMWVSAFFGMCTKYAEIILALKYREKDSSGKFFGGPMYYISKGLGKKGRILSVVFSIFATLASFGIGNIAQSNEISGATKSLFGWGNLFTGIFLASLVAIVTIGDVKRIGKVASYLVPFMSVFYILAGIFAILLRINDLPCIFADIFKNAFSFRSAGGGIAGFAINSAIRQGVSRGIFSNEAGLGSAPIAHATSFVKEPAEQAMWGVFEVFIDTVVICTITGITVMLSGLLNSSSNITSFSSMGELTSKAFNTILPGEMGGTIIQISILFFAFSTILGWSYYGSSCFAFLTNNNKLSIFIYKAVFILLCIVGATGSGTLMWDISDTLNGLMAIPNLIALVLLSPVISYESKKYFSKTVK